MDLWELVKFVELNNWVDYLVVIYLCSFGVQVVYYLFIFSRLAFYKPKQEEESSDPVSVIICAKNERDNILKFLPLYLNQEYPQFEIIVVDDHSVDDTADVLKAFALQFSHLKVVTVPDNDRFYGSKKFALTLGIKAAQYDKLLLTDADCKPSSNKWIRSMSSGSPDKDIVLGFGAYERRKGLLNKLIRFETFYTALQYLSFARARIPYMGVGRNLAYSAELFFKNKGFASHQHILSGDDDLFINEVANRKNTKIVIDHDAHTISNAKTTYKGWMRQKKRHFLTGTHYKFKHKLLLGMLQFSQLIFVGLFIALIIYVRPVYLIVGVFVLRYLIQMTIFKLSANKIGGTDLLVMAPFYELFFMVFNPLMVISNLVIKKTKWN